MGARGQGTAHILAMAVVALAGCGGTIQDEEIKDRSTDAVTVEQAASGTDTWEPCGFTARRVKNIYPGAPSSSPAELTGAKDVLVFSADDGSHGREPWISTGEGRGTQLLKDIRIGTAGSDPSQFTRVGDTVFFVADGGTRGHELWKTDGTASGTKRVKDIRPGEIGSDPANLTAFKGRLYFTADDGVHGRELWRSDGTEDGTRLVRDFAPTGENSGYELAVAGSFLYLKFYSDYYDNDLFLVRTDGTASGFVTLLQYVEDNSIERLTAVGTRLFFKYNNDDAEWSIFVTDGSPAGTRRVREFPREPHDLVAFQGRLYFASGRGPSFEEPDYSGDELWRTDGTLAGTVLVKDVRPGLDGSVPRELTVFKNYLFFTADDGAHGRELWRSDGTGPGTFLLEDFEPGAVGSSPEGLMGHGTRLFFSADTTGRGREPWMHSGGVDGATPLDEIAPGPAASAPGVFVRSGWDLFFAAEDGVAGRELWALPFRPPGNCNTAR